LFSFSQLTIPDTGDQTTLTASRKFARDSYDLSRHLEPGSEQVDDAVKHVQSVTKILRENVVQGKHKEGEHYKLNIHEYTERGDNATAKKMQGSVKSFKEIKDAQF
jgi:complex III assembly factor LYRM7